MLSRWLNRITYSYSDDGFKWRVVRLWPTTRWITFGWQLDEGADVSNIRPPVAKSVTTDVGFRPDFVLMFSPATMISIDADGFTIDGA